MTPTPAQSDETLREAMLDILGVHEDELQYNLVVNIHTGKIDAIIALFAAERQRIYAVVEEAIVDEPCYDPETGKQVHRGESVTIDTIKHLKESLVFIESNGKNNARAELRAEIKRLREGDA